MKLSLATLEQKGACSVAIRAFKALGLPNDETPNIEWTAAAQGWVLASPVWRRWVGWGYSNGIIPLWSMSEADLSEADLSEANLSEADLRGADLRGADLSGAMKNEYTIGWPADEN